MNRNWFGLSSRFILDIVSAHILFSCFSGAMPNREKCVPVEHIIWRWLLSFISHVPEVLGWPCVWFFSWGCVSALIKTSEMLGGFLLIVSCDQSKGCYCKWHKNVAFWAWSLELSTEVVFRLTWLCTAIYCKDVNNVGMESWSFIA